MAKPQSYRQLETKEAKKHSKEQYCLKETWNALVKHSIIPNGYNIEKTHGYAIDDRQESPDFLIELENELIGIEITEVTRKEIQQNLKNGKSSVIPYDDVTSGESKGNTGLTGEEIVEYMYNDILKHINKKSAKANNYKRNIQKIQNTKGFTEKRFSLVLIIYNQSLPALATKEDKELVMQNFRKNNIQHEYDHIFIINGCSIDKL